jgi:hypothetical protein
VRLVRRIRVAVEDQEDPSEGDSGLRRIGLVVAITVAPKLHLKSSVAQASLVRKVSNFADADVGNFKAYESKYHCLYHHLAS